MNLKKILLLPISLALSTAGCAGIGPNATYYMATTSFNYDPSYRPYMVKVNGYEVGGGYGSATMRSAVILGPQIITWGEDNSTRKHKAINVVHLSKEELKNKHYLSVHFYPDDRVEITTSNDIPDPTKKGIDWENKLK